MKKWFDLAEKDFILADHTVRTLHPVPNEIVCFHCQQSAEKFLKGFIVLHDIEPPKIHNLIKLLRMCASINAELSILRAKCSFLNRYSVLPRYPDEIQITDDDVKICLQYAEEVKEFIRKSTQKLTIDETKND